MTFDTILLDLLKKELIMNGRGDCKRDIWRKWHAIILSLIYVKNIHYAYVNTYMHKQIKL